MRAETSHKQYSPASVGNQQVATAEKKSCNGKSVTIVPGEVMVKIFANLSYQELLHCRRVARGWQELIDAFPELRVADARAFYCGGDSRTPMPKAPTMTQDYYLSALNWLTGFGPEGQKAAVQMGSLVRNSDPYLWEKLLFASAQMLAKTALFCCNKVYSFQYDGQITCTCLSPDGQHFLTASCDSRVTICSQVDGRWQSVLTIQYPHERCSIGFSPDSRYVVIAGGYDITLIYQLIGEKWQECPALACSYVGYPPCFSADGNFLVICSVRSDMTIYRLIDNQWLPQEVALDTGGLRGICLHPRDNCLITNPMQGPVKIWRFVDEVWTWEATLKGPVESSFIHLSPDGSRLLITGTIRSYTGPVTAIHIWHGVNGKWTRETTLQATGLADKIHFSPCGHNFAVVCKKTFCFNPDITILIFADGAWETFSCRAKHFYFSRGRRVVVVPTMDAVNICRIDGKQANREATLPGTRWTEDVAFSPHVNHLLTLPRKGDKAKIWGFFAGQWQEKATLPDAGELKSAYFSADGHCIFTLSKDNTVSIWAMEGLGGQ